MNRKALGIAFLSGVLLCGLGCGVAFAQYSKMEYAGERIIGEENIVRETLEAELESEGKILIPSYYTTSYSRYGTTLETDENIPKNKIIFDIEYNPERFAPAVERHTQYEDILYGSSKRVRGSYRLQRRVQNRSRKSNRRSLRIGKTEVL